MQVPSPWDCTCNVIEVIVYNVKQAQAGIPSDKR